MVDEQKAPTKHLYLLSSCRPFNLMGSDLLCDLGMVLISTDTGFKSTIVKEVCQMVKCVRRQLLYMYQWQLYAETPCSVNDFLLQEAHTDIAGLNIGSMQKDCLHCTAYLSEGTDENFEKMR